MTRPFIFNINAADLFTQINNLTTKQRGDFIFQFSIDLLTLCPTSEFSRAIIENTTNAITRRRESGKLGGRPKTNGLAEVKQSQTKAKPKPKQSLSYKEKEKEIIQEGEIKPFLLLPEWMPLDEWNDFVQMRLLLKKPLTQLAEKQMIKKLGELKGTYSIQKVLSRSISHNWQDLYPDDSCKIQDTERPFF